MKMPMYQVTVFIIGLVISGCVELETSMDEQALVMPASDEPTPGPTPTPTPAPTPAPSPGYDLTSWRLKSRSLIDANNHGSSPYIGRINYSHVYLNMQRMSHYNIEQLNNSFNIPNLNIGVFSGQTVESLSSIVDDGAEFQISAQYPGLSSYYNIKQMMMLDNYFNSMLNVTTSGQAYSVYANIKNVVDANTVLTKERKIAIMAIVEYGHAYATAFFNNDHLAIGADIVAEAGAAVQPSPCSIRWRDVWRSAVGSGLVNAAVGGFIGGTAGSFTIPILGTVTGAVGGAVFGFASGFTGGAVGAVAGQFFWNCLMSSPSQRPNTACNDFEYATQNAKFCLTDQAYPNLAIYQLYD